MGKWIGDPKCGWQAGHYPHCLKLARGNTLNKVKAEFALNKR